MKRYLYLLSPLLILLSVSYAVAQTVADVITTTPANTTGQYIWKLVMTAITVGGAVATPYITKYLTIGALKVVGAVRVNVPGPVLIFISTILSGVWAGVLGASTDLPLHGDTAALLGGILGGGVQKFANNEPVRPSQDDTAVASPGV